MIVNCRTHPCRKMYISIEFRRESARGRERNPKKVHFIFSLFILLCALIYVRIRITQKKRKKRNKNVLKHKRRPFDLPRFRRQKIVVKLYRKIIFSFDCSACVILWRHARLFNVWSIVVVSLQFFREKCVRNTKKDHENACWFFCKIASILTNNFCHFFSPRLSFIL